MLALYNTLTREKDAFTPLTPGKVGVYTCGPTVYGTPHIGNLRAYVFADSLRRSLEWLGYDVTHVVNITDVGHLVGDGNEGEDKLEKGARTTSQTVWDIAHLHEAEFFAALDALSIKRPSVSPRATEHIKEQLALIKQLTAKGCTYETSDGIYFDTTTFKHYGRLSGQRLEDKEAGARVSVNDEKRHPADFALWKFCVGENANHTMRWSYETGDDLASQPHADETDNRAAKIGFPGWHIECSAMSAKYLGWQFDIHTGGVDHIPVHHENEIAQSEAATGHRFVNYWLHNEFLTVDSGKMSKSLGNLYTINDLEKRYFEPLAFRYLCLTTHYRQKLNFTWAGLDAAATALDKLRIEFQRLPSAEEPYGEALDEFTAALEDDLNLPQALAVCWNVLRGRLAPAVKAATLLKFDEVLGLGLTQPIATATLTDAQLARLTEREEARARRDFATSDAIRVEFKKAGLEVEDTPAGPLVRHTRLVQ